VYIFINFILSTRLEKAPRLAEASSIVGSAIWWEEGLAATDLVDQFLQKNYKEYPVMRPSEHSLRYIFNT
jgi:hypothetical protein